MGPSTFEKKNKTSRRLIISFPCIKKGLICLRCCLEITKGPQKKIKEAQMISSVAMVAVTIWCTCRRF